MVDTRGRPRDTTLVSGRRHRPNVEVPAVFLKWRRCEQHFSKAARVGFKLLRFTRDITIAENQKINLRRGVAIILNRYQRRGRGGLRTVDEYVLGIDHDGPDIAPGILRVALFQNNLNGGVGSREAQGLAEGARQRLGFVSSFPLAEDGSEPARVKHPF